MIYVLDTYAIFAYFWREPGFQKVVNALFAAHQGKATMHLSRINFGEAYYMAWKKRNRQSAYLIYRSILAMPFIQLESATDWRVFEAARIKAEFPVSYADAFAIGLAIELGATATILTNDSEFQSVQHFVNIDWVN